MWTRELLVSELKTLDEMYRILEQRINYLKVQVRKESSGSPMLMWVELLEEAGVETKPPFYGTEI